MTMFGKIESMNPGDEKLVRDRRDRSKYTLEDALHEIGMAEVILDGCGATRGKTLWGRIASLKGNLSNNGTLRPEQERKDYGKH